MEEFLVAMQLRKNEYQKKKLLVTELGDRNVYTLFEKGTKELIGGLERLPYRDAHFYKEVHELNLGYYGHVETSKARGNMSILKAAVENLDYYYLMQRQRFEFTLKWHKKIIGNKKEITSLTQTKNTLQKESVFKIYALIIKALSTVKNEDIYLEIESLFKNEILRLGRVDKLEIFRILLNHLSSQIHKGKEGYNSKMLSLYKFGLEKDLLIENQKLSETTFLNITSIGVVEKEYDWVNQFINKYKDFLSDNIRDDIVCLTLSLLSFYTGDYSKSIDLILNRQFSKSLYGLKAKSILLRAYFENFLLDDSYYDFLIAQTHSFEKFIRRSDLISIDKKEVYLNFIFYTRKIANSFYQNEFDSELFYKIKNTKPVILKAWLLEKVSLKENKRPSN